MYPMCGRSKSVARQNSASWGMYEQTAGHWVAQNRFAFAVLSIDHRIVSDRTVDSHIKNLRRKFGFAPQVGGRKSPGLSDEFQL